MKKLFLIKLGGSLITDKKTPYNPRLSILKRLCKEIRGLSRKNHTFIVGHGGGSFPHYPAKKYETQRGVVNNKSLKGIAEVQDAAARLNRIVVNELIKAGENAISFSPSSLLITDNGEIKTAFLDSLLQSLELGMLPVVYGDVTFDTKKGCNILSTEKILNYLALKFRSNYNSVKIIYCGITDGVYDETGETVKKISIDKFNRLKRQIGKSEGIDVTGGMLHKVEEALKIAQKKIPTLIINGTRKDELTRAVWGKIIKGTLVAGQN